jgi:hypothetical protein
MPVRNALYGDRAPSLQNRRAVGRKLLRAVFEGLGITPQDGKRFAGEMKGAGNQDGLGEGARFG